MLVDMHAHLDLYPDPIKVVEECENRGVYVLSVTTTPKAWRGTSALANGKKRIKTGLGLHPQLAHQRAGELDLFDSFLHNAKYVGEIGLDGSAEFRPTWDVQLRVFRHILKNINAVGGRLMSIHSRSSAAEVLPELRGTHGIPVLHWFSGNKTELDQAIKQGCWFSIGPAMLASRKGQELTSMIPRNKIVTETDGPFGTIRGKALMPWDVELAVAQLAKIWSIDVVEAKGVVASNFRQLVTQA